MRVFYELEENEYLMAKACKSAEEKGKLINAYNLIQKDCEKSLEEMKYGLVCPAEAILSATTYKNISEIIPKNNIVVDCGCHIGLQQVFFNEHKKYIGIDIRDVFIPISDNAEFICGDIIDVLPKLEVDDSCYGISVLCGSVWENAGKAIKEKFNHIILV